MKIKPATVLFGVFAAAVTDCLINNRSVSIVYKASSKSSSSPSSPDEKGIFKGPGGAPFIR